MKIIELTPKAREDLAAIWDYSFRRYGVMKADEYIGRLSAVFDVLATHAVGTPRPELGEAIFSLPVKQHMIYFVPSQANITIIRILSHAQDSVRHVNWS